MKRIVIIGATSSIAEHCARCWIQKAPVDLVLVGRNKEKTEHVAMDLRVRSPQSTVVSMQIDFLDPIHIKQLADDLEKEAAIDIVLIAHGVLPDQSRCQTDLVHCEEALLVNAVSPVLFSEGFAASMQKAGHGTLAIIGSVAGDRGRKSNYTYGAAKGLVARFAEGLQHRLAGTPVNVVLIKPGPTDTPMTAHMTSQSGRLASASEVAKQIVSGIDKGKPVIYTPAKWALIMWVVRCLPRWVFNRINI